MRLSLHHPEYLYPPSRNPYWKKLAAFPGRIFFDNGTESHPGAWRARFPDSSPSIVRRPLHVEIGCNAGHVVLEWARLRPSDAFIGIDWKMKAAVRAAEKADQRRLPNLLLFRSHADRMKYMFAPGEIDFLYLYFPDPWPKKAQRKNRFVHAERLRELAPLLREGGVFHIKTDHAGYFDWILESIEAASDAWEILEQTRDLHAGHPEPTRLEIPEVTLFEKLFVKDGIKINSVRLMRR